MEMTQAEITTLLGGKELELFVLRREVARLTAEVERLKVLPKKEEDEKK